MTGVEVGFAVFPPHRDSFPKRDFRSVDPALRICHRSAIAVRVPNRTSGRHELADQAVSFGDGKQCVAFSPKSPSHDEVSSVRRVGVALRLIRVHSEEQWKASWFPHRGRGVSIGHHGDGERSGFSDFSLRATKCQASAQPVRRAPLPKTRQRL